MYGCCSAAGAIVGGADQRDIENWYEFGFNLGAALYLKDELRKMTADQSAEEMTAEFYNKSREALKNVSLSDSCKKELQETVDMIKLNSSIKDL